MGEKPADLQESAHPGHFSTSMMRLPKEDRPGRHERLWEPYLEDRTTAWCMSNALLQTWGISLQVTGFLTRLQARPPLANPEPQGRAYPGTRSVCHRDEPIQAISLSVHNGSTVRPLQILHGPSKPLCRLDIPVRPMRMMFQSDL